MYYIPQSPAGRVRVLVVATLVALLVGCVSSRGIQQFALYQAAFEQTNSTANAVLDQLAVQERQLFRFGVRHVYQEFNPDEAAYYSDAGDPPNTGAFRNSLATVDTYNDLLYALVSGQSAASMVAQLGELQVNVSKALGDVGSFAGQGPQAAALGAALGQAFNLLKPAIERGLRQRSRQAFRVYLLQNYPIVREILVEIRGGTAVIFPVLTAAVLQRSRADITSGALTAAEIQKVESYRKILSDWVILIDATIIALDQVNASLSAAPTVAGTVAGLNSIAIDLSAASDAARKDLAELAAH